jgi:hypothetical protein
MIGHQLDVQVSRHTGLGFADKRGLKAGRHESYRNMLIG